MSEDIKHSSRYTYDVKAGTQCFNVTLTFLKYSEAAMERDYYISPFSVFSEFQLELVFTKRDNGIFMKACNRLKRSLEFDVFTVVLDENGKELFGHKKLGAKLTEKENYLYLITCTHRSVYEDRLERCPNDTVIFEIEFRVKNVPPLIRDLYDWNSDEILTEDLKKFILEILPLEIILKTKDDMISVNKAILCARSPVFKKMFCHPMGEQESNTVFIDDLMGITVRNLYDFLYSGKVDLKIEFCYLKELYFAADKYGVMDLRDLCAANILNILTVENWREVLELALLFSDKQFEKGCMIFIGRHIATFMETKYWTDLKSSAPELAIKIFEFHVKGVSI